MAMNCQLNARGVSDLVLIYLMQALEMVMSSQGIARTKQLAAYHAQQAALAIAGLPPSSSRRGQLCRRALTELTQTVINRSK